MNEYENGPSIYDKSITLDFDSGGHLKSTKNSASNTNRRQQNKSKQGIEAHK